MSYSGKLFFTISTPRAGKTTYANKFITEEVNRTIVNSDDIRLALHGKDYVSKAEVFVSAITYTTIRAQLLAGRTVLYDETSTSINSLRNIFEIDINAEPIYIECPLETAIERAHLTGRPYLVPVIERTYDNLRLLAALALKRRYPDCEVAADIIPTQKLVLEGVEIIRQAVKLEKETWKARMLSVENVNV